MASGTTTPVKLNGAALIITFLEELCEELDSVRSKSIIGTPRDIVDRVVRGTTKLDECNSNCLGNLSKQLMLAVTGQHGQPMGLRGKTVGDGHVEIWIV